MNVGGDLFSLDTDAAPPADVPVVEIKPVAPAPVAAAKAPTPAPIVSATIKAAPPAVKAPAAVKPPAAAKPISTPVTAPGSRSESRVCLSYFNPISSGQVVPNAFKDFRTIKRIAEYRRCSYHVQRNRHEQHH